MLEQLVDPLLVALERLGVVELLPRDPREAVAVLHAHTRRRREGRAWIQRPQLDELVRGDVERAQERAAAPDLHVSAYPDRVAPGSDDVPAAHHRRRELTEALLPLVAPDLEIDVDDVVVADREPRDAVAHGERPRLVRGLEPPDDPHLPAEVADAERAGRPAGLELGRGAGPEGLPALRDREHLDPLALSIRDLAEAVGERAGEADPDVLLDVHDAALVDRGEDVGRYEIV
jgi:hypothetical protein